MNGMLDHPGYICMAVYRPDEQLLRAQITSILYQTVGEWQCLVGIDGSDTGTEAVLRSLIGDDQRFSILPFESRTGFYRNFERILAEVPRDAAWVALSDQDDEWAPNKLEVLVPRLEFSSLVVGQARIRERDADSALDGVHARVTHRRAAKLNAMMIDNQVTGSLAVFRREVLDGALPFPEATDLSFHDHWLGICALLSEGVEMVPIVVQDYLQHAGNVIGESSGNRISERVHHLKRRSGGTSVIAHLDYISAHRWGWRVSMARAATHRFRSLPVGERRILAAYAKNRFTYRFLVASTADILARMVPVGRTLALFAGSLRAPQASSTPLSSAANQGAARNSAR